MLSEQTCNRQRQTANQRQKKVVQAVLSEKKYTEADECPFRRLPETPYFREWKQDAIDKVCKASGRPDEAFTWIREVEQSRKTFDQLADSGDFVTLDAKIASGLTDLLRNDDLKRRAQKAKEEAQTEGRRVRG